MSTMADCHWGLTDLSKGRKDRAILGTRRTFLESSINRISSKALYCVALQVRGSSTILRVLITANPSTLVFAAFGGTLEKMICSIFLSYNLDIALEETIYGWAPSFLQAFCNMSTSAPAKKKRTALTEFFLRCFIYYTVIFNLNNRRFPWVPIVNCELNVDQHGWMK